MFIKKLRPDVLWQSFKSRLPLLFRDAALKQQQLQDLKTELDDANLLVSQLSSALKEIGGLFPPPLYLQKRVMNRYLDRFFEDGAATVMELDRILAPTGHPLRSFETILDFGAGCARIARPLRSYVGPAAKIYATDIDRETMEWCRHNYGSLADFEVNDAWPPLNYSDNTFDFIYGLSVFTHLPEDMQFKWLAELNRILKPQGYLILSTHGRGYYDRIPPHRLAELEAAGFLHFNNGLTEGLPDFYRTTFHTHGYIHDRWSQYLEIISIEEQGILGRQDAILCSKKK